MIITKEIDYALRVLRVLADGSKRNITQISNETYVPESFAYKITRKLAKQHWITIYRGVDGGYESKKPINEITLLDVINLIGDKREISSCISENHECKWKNDNNNLCNVNKNLILIQRNLEEELRKQTLDVLFFS